MDVQTWQPEQCEDDMKGPILNLQTLAKQSPTLYAKCVEMRNISTPPFLGMWGQTQGKMVQRHPKRRLAICIQPSALQQHTTRQLRAMACKHNPTTGAGTYPKPFQVQVAKQQENHQRCDHELEDCQLPRPVPPLFHPPRFHDELELLDAEGDPHVVPFAPALALALAEVRSSL